MQGSAETFVSRERGLVRYLEIVATETGRVSYRVRRTFLFETEVRLARPGGGEYHWTLSVIVHLAH